MYAGVFCFYFFDRGLLCSGLDRWFDIFGISGLQPFGRIICGIGFVGCAILLLFHGVSLLIRVAHTSAEALWQLV